MTWKTTVTAASKLPARALGASRRRTSKKFELLIMQFHGSSVATPSRQNVPYTAWSLRTRRSAPKAASCVGIGLCTRQNNRISLPLKLRCTCLLGHRAACETAQRTVHVNCTDSTSDALGMVPVKWWVQMLHSPSGACSGMGSIELKGAPDPWPAAPHCCQAILASAIHALAKELKQVE